MLQGVRRVTHGAKGGNMDFARAHGSPVTAIAVAAVAVLAMVLADAASASPLTRTEVDAIRLLEQSTWGPNDNLIAEVQSIGVAGFIDKQIATPPTG